MSKMLPAEYKTPGSHQMLNQNRSMSSCSNMERFLPLGLQTSVPSLHRSVSDSIALLEKPYFNQNGLGGDFTTGADHVEPSDGHDVPRVPDTSKETEPQIGTQFNPNMDPKKIKRMLANRESARRSRLRKLEYIEKLKKDIVSEEAKVSLMSPQVSFYELQREMLEKENNVLKQKIEVLADVKAYKEAEFRALIEERNAMNLTNMLPQQGK